MKVLECEILFNFDQYSILFIHPAMILGVYWYFKFPENLYHFKFFRFFQGYGGHSDNLAELKAKVQVNTIDSFLNKLEKIKAQFPHTYLYLSINEKQLIITIGDYYLFDYYFQLAAEIEDLLIEENAILLEERMSFEILSQKIYNAERKKPENTEHRFIQLTGSDFMLNNAEHLSIRIDCNLPVVHKRNFINDITLICREENISIFYYQDYDFKDQCNLMLFFTNGRQYKDDIQLVLINSFGSKIRHLAQKYPFHFGHFGGMKYYPLNGPHVELMTDESYILNRNK